MSRFPSYKTVKRASQRYLREHQTYRVIGDIDGWQCVYCGINLLDMKRRRMFWRITVDHIQPLCLAFHLPLEVINHPINLVIACHRCNTKLGGAHARDKEARFGRFKGKRVQFGNVLPAIYLFSAEEYRRLPSTERSRLCSEISLPQPVGSDTA